MQPHPKQAAPLRAIAGVLQGVTEGVACPGTAIEALTFAIGSKNFLFAQDVGGTLELRLKLAASRAEAEGLAAGEPGRYHVGTNGWTKIVLPAGETFPATLLERWIGESYGVLSPPPAKTKAKKRPMPPDPGLKPAAKKGRKGPATR